MSQTRHTRPLGRSGSGKKATKAVRLSGAGKAKHDRRVRRLTGWMADLERSLIAEGYSPAKARELVELAAA
jgi:endonuclease YncB( thermonuclease family)